MAGSASKAPAWERKVRRYKDREDNEAEVFHDVGRKTNTETGAEGGYATGNQKRAEFVAVDMGRQEVDGPRRDLVVGLIGHAQSGESARTRWQRIKSFAPGPNIPAAVFEFRCYAEAKR